MGMQFAREFASDRAMDVEPVAVDQHGRESVWVFAAGANLNLELVRRGLAYWDRTQAPTQQDLNQAEAEAREKRLGIWSHTPGRQDR
jgi:endonuclease YncB( thermonuclease family)